MKYIDAEKLIAEIERLQKASAITMEELQMDEPSERMRGELNAYDDILYFIDSLQQEQPEVDLEKEIEKWFDMMGESWENGYWSTNDIRSTARHFFELGGKLCSK